MKNKGPGIQKLINDCNTIIVTEKAKEMSFEKLYNMIQECWWETKKQDNIVIYTGIEGRVNYQEQLVKYMGGTFTEENREKFRQQLIDNNQTIFKI